MEKPYFAALDELYQQILSRSIDPSGYETYSSLLITGEKTLDDIGRILRDSEEYARLQKSRMEKPYFAELNELYRKILYRSIDESGYESYSVLLTAGERTLDDIDAMLRNSEEYKRILKNQAARPCAKSFYLIDGTEINYEVIGDEGTWVALISGGRASLIDLEELAQAIASCGHRVIIHDRRNCGRSSIRFDNLEAEDDFWAADLSALITHLDAAPALVAGRSRGVRIAIQLALYHPNAVRGLLLWGLSGGEVAARSLNEYYYGQYLRACQTGGMAAVCILDHFAGLSALQPANREMLLALDPAVFLSAMSRWRDAFLAGKDYPVIGVSDDDLRRINVPTAIVPYYDKMHPYETAVHANSLIPGSRFFDIDPLRRENKHMTEIDELHDTAAVAEILCEMDLNLPEFGTSSKKIF